MSRAEMEAERRQRVSAAVAGAQLQEQERQRRAATSAAPAAPMRVQLYANPQLLSLLGSGWTCVHSRTRPPIGPLLRFSGTRRRGRWPRRADAVVRADALVPCAVRGGCANVAITISGGRAAGTASC